MSGIDSFRAKMQRHGLEYTGQIIADGRLRRFKAEGDRDRNSWFVLYPGPPCAGAFGCWKRGVNETWCEKRIKDYSDSEWRSIRETWQRAGTERNKIAEARRVKARQVAARILKNAKPASDDHPYLIRKGVHAREGLHVWRGDLVVPLMDTAGDVHSLQFIGTDGGKLFLSGGRVTGCMFPIFGADTIDTSELVICEGFGTGASIHEATSLFTVAAMNCGNLKPVALALRGKWPKRQIILASDDDAWTAGNPGLTAATEAAKAIGAKLAVPKFKDTATKQTDFNDLHQLEGLETVKTQIEAATEPTESDEECFERLAKLSSADYDRCRDAEAKRLNIRIATLDAEISKRRPGPTGDNAQGSVVKLPDVVPWEHPVDGAQVLHEVSATFTRYLWLPPGAADVFALFTAHAHAFTAFLHTPRLNLFSPEKRCGKTVALDVLASLTPRSLRTENITPAVLFRLVESCKPTLLLDEVDTYLNEAEELRGLLNAGHKRGAMALRCEGENNIVRGFSAFAPAALAGIGALPGTLHDRSIVVKLTRAKPGEVKAQFDSRHINAETELCRKLAKWCQDNFSRLEECDPALPEAAFNRLADNWRPLFAVAEVTGGDWPRRAADAFAKLTSDDDLDAQGIGATLLADIAGIFAATGEDKLPSAKLVSALVEIEGRPWAEFGKAQKPISPNQLAKQLRRFGVAPCTIRVGDETAKGYALSDFTDAFERFLPAHRFQTVTP